MRESHSTGTHIGTLIALLIAAALLAGVGYEQFSRARDRRSLPQIGRSIDIGGRSLNIDCAGAGAPTVIFESATPRPGYSWLLVQRAVAAFTRACWYDRAGYGRSDLGPYPRTSSATARDLHALLEAAAIPPPYVLTGTGTAALDFRVFVSRYPSHVAGLVLADPLPPDLPARLPQTRGAMAPLQKYIGYPQSIAAQVFSQIGLMRLALSRRREPTPPPLGFSAAEWTTIWDLAGGPKAHTALLQDMSGMDPSLAEARAAQDFGDRPLIVLISLVRGLDRQVILEMQAGVARWSSRGKPVEIQAATPFEFQAPAAVAAAVHEVLNQVRGTRY